MTLSLFVLSLLFHRFQHWFSNTILLGITQGQFSELMDKIEKVNETNDEIKQTNDEIKQMVEPKVQCMNASTASSNDLHEMFNDCEIQARYIVEGYHEVIDEAVLLKIYEDVKEHTKAVIKLKVKKGKEMNEIRDIQSLSYALLVKVTSHTLPAESYDVKRNGYFKTSEVAAESSDRVVKFRGKYDEMVNAKGTTFAVYSLEDKNPKSKKIPKKAIAQGVIQTCGMFRALSSIDCAPKHLFTFVHNGLEWIVVLRRINSSGAEQYMYTAPVECTMLNKKTKVVEISESGLDVVSRLLYIAMKTTLNTLAAVESRLKSLLHTNQHLPVSEFNEDFDDEGGDDEEEPHGDSARGSERLSTLLGSLKLPSGRASTQQEKQKTSTAGTKSTAGQTQKKKSTLSFSRTFEYLQLTAKNLMLAPAMC